MLKQRSLVERVESMRQVNLKENLLTKTAWYYYKAALSLLEKESGI